MKTRKITDSTERAKIIKEIREASYTNPCDNIRAHRVAWTIIVDTLGFKPVGLGRAADMLERRSDLPLIVRNNYGIA